MDLFCGVAAIKQPNAPVDLSNPDFRLYIEVRDDDTYIFHQKIQSSRRTSNRNTGKNDCTGFRRNRFTSCNIPDDEAGFDITIVNFNNHPFTSGLNEKIIKIYNKLSKNIIWFRS